MQQTFIQLGIEETKPHIIGLMKPVPVVINNVLYLRLEIKKLYVRSATRNTIDELSVLDIFGWITFC